MEIEWLQRRPLARSRFELVERKGKGHPDTICDAVVEAISRELCRAYLERTGRVQHYNVDKALLLAGVSRPRLGAGELVEPMRFVLGGRATDRVGDLTIPVGELARAAFEAEIRSRLRYVDPQRHFTFESALRPGAAALADIFERPTITANDTSAGVGYAPLTETERTVLAVERHLASPDFQQRFPEAGEDIKIMGARTDRRLELTIALAFVGRSVPSTRAYYARKEDMHAELMEKFGGRLVELDALGITINALDDPERGEAGMYLTVLGTSAEAGDDGQVGRGNRVHGLIPFLRHVSLEAAAGKNPVSHVGKIYDLLAFEIAERIHRGVAGLDEVEVFLCSRIGQPIERPWWATARLAPSAGVALADVEEAAWDLLESGVASAPVFVAQLLAGERRITT